MEKQLLQGTYDSLGPEEQELILRMTAMFHYRDGAKHSDGSMGTIKITHNELKNSLAYIMKYPLQPLVGSKYA